MFRNRKSKKFNKKQIYQKNELSFSERTTRLVLVLTIIGGIFGFIGRFYLDFFVYSFSSRVPMEFSIGAEHIVLICLGINLTMIIGNIIVYIWREFNSFNLQTNLVEVTEQKIKKANQAYSNIFKSINMNLSISSIIIVVFIVVRSFYFKDRLVIGMTLIFTFLILSIIILFCIKKKYKFDPKKILNLITRISITRVWAFVIISFLWCLFGIITMIPKQPIDIRFENSNIVIDSNNYPPQNVSITFMSFDRKGTPLTKKIRLKEDDFKIAFQEVIENPNINDDYLYQLRKTSPSSDQVIQMGNSMYNYRYKLDYRKYIKEGENFVRITFDAKGFSSNKKTTIVTPIIYKNKKYDIQQNKFHIK
ncbi:hypothetical protein WGM54_18325 [Paenibacillus polymyxa]|uniref:hypothetical protein n=1 Tax=Paenibacillus polymyxa TaxID=1406 RepID=UPI00307EE80F